MEKAKLFHERAIHGRIEDNTTAKIASTQLVKFKRKFPVKEMKFA